MWFVKYHKAIFYKYVIPLNRKSVTRIYLVLSKLSVVKCY